MAYEIKYRSDNEMKDSGIEWLGKVPKEWEVKKLKFVFSYFKGKNPDTFVDSGSGGIPYITTEYLRKGSTDYFVDSYKGLVKVFDDDILLLWDGANAGEFFDGKEGVLGSTFAKFNLISNNYKNYLKYCLRAFESYLKANTTGMGLPHVNSEILKSLLLNLPTNILDQQKIANFLDIKIAEFDTIISKKEQLIEKLEEAKKSLISEVVTGKVKVVDGQLVDRKPEEMKDSGVEWLGTIPKDWEVKRIKYISKLNNKTLSNNEKKELNINYIDIGSVDKTGTINQVQELTFEEAPSRARRIVTYKDTIVSTVRTYLKAISYIDKKYNEFICSTGFAVFTPNKNFVFPKFFYYMIMSEEYINQIMSNSVGVSYPAINASDITNFPCVLPNLEEQTRITNLLEEYLNKLNSIITKTKQQISKLKEAKQSLISEAVTGKIDLRDWEIIETGGR